MVARRRKWKSVSAAGSGRFTPRLGNFALVLTLGFIAAIGGLWIAFVGLARLVGASISVWRPRVGDVPFEFLYDIAKSTVTIAAFLAGVFAIVYSYRKQKVEEAASAREDERLFVQRYQEASMLLGNEEPAVRLAGVYALVSLADDWVEQRQQCVDVLCSYLRLVDGKYVGKQEEVIQSAIIDQIEVHASIYSSPEISWSSLRIDLSDTSLDGISWGPCAFSNLILDNSRVDGDCSIIVELKDGGRLNAHSIIVKGSLFISSHGEGQVQVSRTQVCGGGAASFHVGSSGVKLIALEMKVASGARCRVNVNDDGGRAGYEFSSSEVLGDLTFDGKGERLEPGAIWIKDLKTSGEGALTFRDKLLWSAGKAQRDVVYPFPLLDKNVRVKSFWASEPQVVDLYDMSDGESEE